MVNILHATPKTNPWPLKNIAAIDNSSLNFRAQQKCLRSKLRPRHSGVRGFFVPLSPPEMNCLENDETDQCAATQSGCHGPAPPAPALFWFDIRRNMPHTDSLTFDEMSPPPHIPRMSSPQHSSPGTASATSAVPSAHS